MQYNFDQNKPAKEVNWDYGSRWQNSI